jgi:hypothetical protein
MAETNHTEGNDLDRQEHMTKIQSIRRALHIGLASYGEVERVTNEVELAKLCNKDIPKGIKPIHPTGCCETVGEFAEALRFLDELAEMPLAA